MEEYGLGNQGTVSAALGCAVKAVDDVRVYMPELCKIFEIDNWRTI